MNMREMVRLVGAKGIYLYICKSLRINPMPVRIPVFGLVRTYNEIRNIRDNFVFKHLRDENIELYLSKKKIPYVIDCGVNVGVTVRWWFHLNSQAKVFGIDMMDEAQKFTVEAVKSLGIAQERYKPIVAALWSRNEKQFKIGIADPLLGDTGFYRNYKNENERVVTTRTLDTIFGPEEILEVDLLKIDLEGAGGEALRGAVELLKKTRNIVFEIHSEEESKLAGSVLAENGFLLKGVTGRHTWWERRKKALWNEKIQLH